MTYTAQRAVREVETELSSALISTSAQLGLRELVGRFPVLGGTQYLECRLDGANPQVDFLVSVTRHQRLKLKAALATESAPGLTGLGRFLARWVDPDSELHEQVPVIWLEFDDVLRQRAPSANVCICISPAYVDPYAPLQSLPARESLGLIAASARAVLGIGTAGAADSASASLELALAACANYIECLPIDAHFVHLSVMQERRPMELKLYGSFPQGTLLPYLQRIGWAGDLHEVERILSRYCPPERTGGTLHVDLPLPTQRGPVTSLGISFAQQQFRHAAEREPARTQLLRALAADGLASDDKVAALELWPREVLKASDRFGVSDRVQTWCDVKMVYRAGQPLSAKAYLGFVAEPRFNRPLQSHAGDSPEALASSC